MKIIKINKDDRYFREIFIIYKNWISKSSYGFDEKTELEKYLKSFNEDKLPNIYALIINDTLIGMYELNEKDHMDNLPYKPYLANVFIKEEYRGRGYSKMLVEHSIKTCEALNYKKLYLHTHHKNLYERYGFKYLEDVETQYGTKSIYVIDLKSTSK
jgi:GNAT superfamily N-acetyltransferase